MGQACLWLLLLGLGCAAPGKQSAPIAGDWSGNAVFRGASLAFTVRFTGAGDSLRATFSSPDLLLLEQPLDSVRQTGSAVGFTTPDDHPLRFEGVREGDSIRGIAVVPVVPGVVERTDGADAVHFVLRRGPPLPPLSYFIREVRFQSGDATLAATLWIPERINQRRAGIVLLQGSSSSRRHEYRFYADHFARMGLVVLTFDRRGEGDSSGNPRLAAYDDLAADAAAAVEFLRRRPEVSPAPVGIWGMSQGAFLAPLVAARVPSLAFVVAVSPPGVTIGESAAYQDSLRLVAGGFPVAEAARAASLNRRIVDWLRTGRGEDTLAAALARERVSRWLRFTSLPQGLPADSIRAGWYWAGRTLDPIPGWRGLRVPVLVVFGAADELVPASISAARIEQALQHGAAKDFTVRVFPAANHILRRLPLVSGGAWDWPRAAPGYLELTTQWIRRHLSR